MDRAERIGVDEGLALIRRHVRLAGQEDVAIDAALGRVTAAPIFAARTVPAFRAAAMDGFAIHGADVATATPEAPIRLPVTARVPAGTWPAPLAAGQACSIGTGAPVPDGADCVIMREHVRIARDGIAISAPARPGLNVREIGEDRRPGQEIVPRGMVVTPDIVGGLVAYGVGSIPVFRAPGFALIVTGSELSAGGGDARAAILDSNGPMIRAYAASIGATIHSAGIAEDSAPALDAALDRALATCADIVVSTGGASQGDHDCVRASLERRGAHILFHGLAMRPGKPILFAILPDGRPFFGLPGNPVSACIGMRFFVGQALRAMVGLPDEAGVTVASTEPGRDGATLFLRGCRTVQADGSLRIDTGLDQRSHILSSLIAADSWLRVDRVDGHAIHRAFPKALTLVP